jgi:hypothetical protein
MSTIKHTRARRFPAWRRRRLLRDVLRPRGGEYFHKGCGTARGEGDEVRRAQSDLEGAAADREEGQEEKDGVRSPRSARRSRARRLRPGKAGGLWERFGRVEASWGGPGGRMACIGAWVSFRLSAKKRAGERKERPRCVQRFLLLRDNGILRTRGRVGRWRRSEFVCSI